MVTDSKHGMVFTTAYLKVLHVVTNFDWYAEKMKQWQMYWILNLGYQNQEQPTNQPKTNQQTYESTNQTTNQPKKLTN